MIRYLILLLSVLFNYAFAAPSATQLLKNSDKYRLPYKHANLKISIDEYKKDSINKSVEYDVYYRSGESLVDIRSGASKGNRVLLSDKGMYVLVKRSSRPVRITPIQRLLGQASYGDLAGLQLSDDYNSELLKEENDTIVLKLSAKNKKATYSSINLWINKQQHYPIKAEAYLRSGKLYKKMRYIVKDNLVSDIIYTLPDVSNKKTIMQFDSIIEKKIPNRLFTSNGMRGRID